MGSSVRNMAYSFGGFPKEYKIKYYSPYDQVNSIKEETRWSGALTLEFPKMDTMDIVLFEVFPMGDNFKSMQSDTTNSEDSITKEPQKEKEDKVIVYPNPNDGNFVVFIENIDKVKFIQILDNLGKQIDLRTIVRKENQFNSSAINPGVYFVEVLFEDKIVRKKIIVN